MKKETKIALDTVRVIEQNNQVTYWRKATGVPQECAAWLQTQELDRKQIDEIANECAYLQRRNERFRREIRDETLRYSCDVNSQLTLLSVLVVVAVIVGGIAHYAEQFTYLESIGIGVAFSLAAIAIAHFVFVPLMSAWDKWRSGSRKSG